MSQYIDNAQLNTFLFVLIGSILLVALVLSTVFNKILKPRSEGRLSSYTRWRFRIDFFFGGIIALLSIVSGWIITVFIFKMIGG